MTVFATGRPSPMAELESRVRSGAVAALQTLLSLQFLMLQSKRHDESIKAGEAALLLQPDNVDALYWKALALIAKKEIAERAQARTALERVLSIKPDHVAAMGTLASVYMAIGPFESAQPLLSRLLELNPADATALAMQRELQGRLVQDVELVSPPAVDSEGGSRPAGARRKIKRSRFPVQVSELQDFHAAVTSHLLSPIADVKPFIHSRSRAFTMGSCFAGRIGRELKRLGLDATHMQLAETVNTTFANLEFMKWVCDSGPVANAAYFDQEMTGRGLNKASLREIVAKADFLVYTLGVAPAFFNKQTGCFAPHSADDFKQFDFLRDHEYRTSTVNENLENLRQILQLVRELNPGIKFVVSVSPVPLAATFEMASAIQADCVSKSVLRVAANEFVKLNLPDVIYWPSFEMVRWFGGHVGQVFGTDDGCNFHVGDKLVSQIVEAFLNRFSIEPMVKGESA